MQIRYNLPHFLDKILLLVENIVFIVCFLELIVGHDVESVGDLLLGHVEVTEDTQVTVEVRVLLVL